MLQSRDKSKPEENMDPYITLNDVYLRYPLHAKLINDPNSKVGGHLEKDKRGRQWISALRGINLDIRPGQRVGITGHNGAGKSTLLQILARTQMPTSGRVAIVGKTARLLSPGAGMQAFATGLENIKMRGMLQGMTDDEIEDAIPAIDEFTELGPYLNIPIAQYSGGMRLRLSFAVATAMKPDILLIDEWMGAGDRAFQAKARARFDAFTDHASILVLASHNESLVKSFCTREVRIDKGEIAEDKSL